MSIRVHRPETDRLDLSRGDFLIVRRRLTMGEYRAMLARMVDPASTGDRPRSDPLKVAPARIAAYLLDWSFDDPEGQRLGIRDQPPEVIMSVLDMLEPADFTEVDQAIAAHEARMEAARETEKKMAGATRSSPTSPSPDTSAGVTNGSPRSIATSTPS